MDEPLAFVAALDKKAVSYSLGVARPTAVMVSVVIPGHRVEEFFADKTVEIERFTSSEGVASATEQDLAAFLFTLD
jgi:hypothetical protein